jgi:hypothetical protein
MAPYQGPAMFQLSMCIAVGVVLALLALNFMFLVWDGLIVPYCDGSFLVAIGVFFYLVLACLVYGQRKSKVKVKAEPKTQ